MTVGVTLMGLAGFGHRPLGLDWSCTVHHRNDWQLPSVYLARYQYGQKITFLTIDLKLH
jgi:hypothetical protein